MKKANPPIVLVPIALVEDNESFEAIEHRWPEGIKMPGETVEPIVSVGALIQSLEPPPNRANSYPSTVLRVKNQTTRAKSADLSFYKTFSRA